MHDERHRILLTMLILTASGCELFSTITSPETMDAGVGADASVTLDAGGEEDARMDAAMDAAADLGAHEDLGINEPDASQEADVGPATIADHYVCPTLETDPRCTATSIASAQRFARSGESIAIHSGDYSECVLFDQDEITIFGVGDTRPRIIGDACGKIPDQDRENLFWFTGTDVVIENVHFEEARTENGRYPVAGVYVDQANVTLRDVSFHDVDSTLFYNGTDANPTHSITLERVTADDVGAKLGRTYFHGIRIRGADEVTMSDVSIEQVSYSAHGVSIVNSNRVDIECTRVATLTGLASYVLEVVNAQRASIRDSLLVQGPNVENSTLMRLSVSKLIEIENATLLNDRGNGTFITLNETPSMEPYIVTSTFAGPGNLLSGFPEEYRLPASNSTPSNRSQLANFGEYPTPSVPPMSDVIGTCHAFE